MSTITTARPGRRRGHRPARSAVRGQPDLASCSPLVLVTPTPVAVVLLALQAVVFAHRRRSAASSTRRTPGSSGPLVRPRLGAPRELEDPRPPRFAQAVGLGFAVVGPVGFAAGLTALALVATGLALAAALLNAVFGFCLGCEIYLLLQRATASADLDPAPGPGVQER